MGWGEQDVMVAVAIHAGVDVVDEAAVAMQNTALSSTNNGRRNKVGWL